MTPVEVMSASFILLCVLIGGSSAFPPFSKPVHDEGVGSSTPTFLSESLKHFSSDADPIERERERMKSVLGGIAFIELPSLAGGSHFMVPLAENTDLEQEYKTVAIAVSKLLMNLKSMERCDKFQRNVSEMVISKLDFQQINDTGSHDGFLRTFWHSYNEGIDNKFGTDEELATEYKIQKSKAKKIVEHDPGMHEPVFKVKDVMHRPLGIEELMTFMRGNENYCDFLLTYTVFLDATTRGWIFNSTDYKHRLMVKALLQKARQSSDYESEVNKIYHNVLARVRPTMTSQPVPITPFVKELFFNLIETELASNPELQKEIGVLMKQIEDKSSIGQK